MGFEDVDILQLFLDKNLIKYHLDDNILIIGLSLYDISEYRKSSDLISKIKKDLDI